MGYDHDGRNVGTPCSACGAPRVRVDRQTLTQAVQELQPRLHSLPQNALKTKLPSFAICPRCDAYALGIDRTEGYPVTDQNGRRLTVHDLE